MLVMMILKLRSLYCSDVCMYNGKAYTQGQKWSDKCDKNCVCDDAKQGLYTCTDRYTCRSCVQ